MDTTIIVQCLFVKSRGHIILGSVWMVGTLSRNENVNRLLLISAEQNGNMILDDSSIYDHTFPK